MKIKLEFKGIYIIVEVTDYEPESGGNNSLDPDRYDPGDAATFSWKIIDVPASGCTETDKSPLALRLKNNRLLWGEDTELEELIYDKMIIYYKNKNNC